MHGVFIKKVGKQSKDVVLTEKQMQRWWDEKLGTNAKRWNKYIEMEKAIAKAEKDMIKKEEDDLDRKLGLIDKLAKGKAVVKEDDGKAVVDEVKGMPHTRCSPTAIRALMKQLSEEKKLKVKEMGFEWLVNVGGECMWKDELEEALGCVRQSDWKFVSPGTGTEIQLGPELVEEMLQLKNEGRPVPTSIPTPEEEECRRTFEEERFRKLKLSEMFDFLVKKPADHEDWRAIFLILALTRYLASSNKNGVQVHLFDAAAVYRNSEQCNWAEYV